MAEASLEQRTTYTDLQPTAGPTKVILRFFRQKPIGAVAGVVCVLLVLVAIFANALAPYEPDAVNHPRLQAPSLSYPFGTDNLFRDMFSRTIVGSRLSIGIGFASVAIGTIAGTVLGLVSGYFVGKTDMVVARLMDVILGIPPLVLAVFFLTIYSPSFVTVSLAIGLIITPTTARIVRGSVLSIRTLQYIEAAQCVGNNSTRIMARHVLPNVFAPIIVIASIQIGNAILAEAALSFLGLGVASETQPSWGKMLQDTRVYWETNWWTAVVPGAAISLAVLSFNLFGDALRDVLDPRLRGAS
jgi:peptide/nickel transport system permease protein